MQETDVRLRESYNDLHERESDRERERERKKTRKKACVCVCVHVSEEKRNEVKEMAKPLLLPDAASRET